MVQTTYPGLAPQPLLASVRQLDEDLPERFYHEDWKLVFFRLTRFCPLTLSLIRGYLGRRSGWTQHYLDTWQSNEKAKEDIMRRLQCETAETVGEANAEEFDRRRTVGLVCDNYIRLAGWMWRRAKGSLTSKGVWAVEGVRMRLGEGSIVMKERRENRFEYFVGEEALERKVFGESQIETDIIMLAGSVIQKEDQTRSIGASEERKGRASKGMQINIQNGVDILTPKLSDDDDFEQDEDDDDPFEGARVSLPTRPSILPPADPPSSAPAGIVCFLSRMLSARDKHALKKRYIPLLKDFIYSSKLFGQSGLKLKELITDLRCELLRPFYKRSGTLTLTSHDIVFIDELAPGSEAEDNIFFFQYRKRDDQLRYKVVSLAEVREIQRRRWLGRKTALELFLMSGKSIILNF